MNGITASDLLVAHELVERSGTCEPRVPCPQAALKQELLDSVEVVCDILAHEMRTGVGRIVTIKWEDARDYARSRGLTRLDGEV